MIAVRLLNTGFTIFGTLLSIVLGLYSVAAYAAPAARPKLCIDAAFSEPVFQLRTSSNYWRISSELKTLIGEVQLRPSSNSLNAIHYAMKRMSRSQMSALKNIIRENYLEVNLRKYDHQGMYELRRVLDFMASRIADPLNFFRAGKADGKSVSQTYKEFIEKSQKDLGLPKTYDYEHLVNTLKWLQSELRAEVTRNPKAAEWKFNFYGSMLMGKGVLPFSDIDATAPTDKDAANFISKYRWHRTLTIDFGFDHLSLNKSSSEKELIIKSSALNPIFITLSADRMALQVFPLGSYNDTLNGVFANSDSYEIEP